MKSILLFLSCLVAPALVAAQDYMPAVVSACMQNITAFTTASEAKIRWQQRNCQDIWSELRERVALESSSEGCKEVLGRVAPVSPHMIPSVLAACRVRRVQ